MKKEKKVNGKLPGSGWRILSFIPGLNWVALIYAGLRCPSVISVLCGVLYGIVSFAIPSTAAFFWIIGAIQYAVVCGKMKKEKGLRENGSPKGKKSSVKKQEVTYGSVTPQIPESKKKDSGVGYAEVILSGAEEKRQPVPSRTAADDNRSPASPHPAADENKQPVLTWSGASGEKNPYFDLSFSRSSSEDKFFKEMKLFEDRAGVEAPFVPFMAYSPSYDSMNRQQQAWYFYWRTQVRGGVYPDTDLSYLFIHIYELLSGCGWKEPQDGYDQLLRLWTSYHERFPKLDSYLSGWSFDFAQLHHLQYRMPEIDDIQLPYQQTVRDILIDQHREDKPLKLSLALIDAMCDYSIVGSKFYKDGRQLLMQEAIPRVVALADAALLKKKGKGILAVYGPNRTRKQSYYAFQSAVCPGANRQTEVSVRAYTSSEKLRSYMNELVRYGENVLRSLYGARGRLRGVALDEETAALVEAFLKKEYTPGGSPADEQAPRAEVKLDFDNIDELRVQSDAVREALEVREDGKEQKELLTELQEVQALFAELSGEEMALLDTLQQKKWECRYHPEMQRQMDGINRLANKYLACALLVLEQDQLLAEDDYRDELDYIYADRSGAEKMPGQCPPEVEGSAGQRLPGQEGNAEQRQLTGSEGTELYPPKSQEGIGRHMPEERDGGVHKEIAASGTEEMGWFDLSALSDELRELMENLTPVQQETLWTIVFQEHPQQRLEQIAEEEMTMPQMLIDEINDIATQYLDDILIDAFEEEPYILEQYAPELRNTGKQEEK